MTSSNEKFTPIELEFIENIKQSSKDPRTSIAVPDELSFSRARELL